VSRVLGFGSRIYYSITRAIPARRRAPRSRTHQEWHSSAPSLPADEATSPGRGALIRAGAPGAAAPGLAHRLGGRPRRPVVTTAALSVEVGR
jgi:hypothetical protein